MSKRRKENRNRKVLNNRVNLQSKSYTIVQSAAGELSENESIRKPSLFSKLKANWLVVLIIAFLSLGALGAALKYLEDDAKREIARRESQKGKIVDKNESAEPLLNRINPFLPAPLPDPTPALSREYLYSGSKLLAVESAGATAAPPADIAVWRPSTGDWWVHGSMALS